MILAFLLPEVPFSIDNESTWEEGMIPVAKLFYNFMEELIKSAKIQADEIEKLKTKTYTKTLFRATDYPAVANSITDNMGNSTHKRYRSKPLSINGTDIFISTQFFESDRENVIDWYKKHL